MAIRAIGNANEHPPVQDQEHFVLVNRNAAQPIGGKSTRLKHRYSVSIRRALGAQNEKTRRAVRHDETLVHGEYWSEG